ncbi:hypothetical protein HB779_11270 [Phyllobacterium sp. 628]|nr:hypothetical protein HB779_11270 [Phyllobacterium sp. 628]
MAISMIFNQSSADEHKIWAAGQYTFSDELGGFTIRAISGSGTQTDPFTITEEFNDVAPTTLIIRTDKTTQLSPTTENAMLFHLRIVAINGSGHSWTEFGFELQEQLGKASDYSDGLSFYQPGDKTGMIHSNLFATYDDNFEPYDRMIFREGKVDPKANASFDFPIGDFTPKRTFYLVQEPRIPST